MRNFLSNKHLPLSDTFYKIFLFLSFFVKRIDLLRNRKQNHCLALPFFFSNVRRKVFFGGGGAFQIPSGKLDPGSMSRNVGFRFKFSIYRIYKFMRHQCFLAFLDRTFNISSKSNINRSFHNEDNHNGLEWRNRANSFVESNKLLWGDDMEHAESDGLIQAKIRFCVN